MIPNWHRCSLWCRDIQHSQRNQKKEIILVHCHIEYKLLPINAYITSKEKATLLKTMSSGFDGSDFISNTHDVLHQRRSDFDAFQSGITATKPKRKRESTLRKAPGAPKRFKSSYILFFMAQREDIKKELGSKASVSLCCVGLGWHTTSLVHVHFWPKHISWMQVGEISKRSSE